MVHSRDFHPANHCFFADNNAGALLFTEVQLRSDARQTMWLRHSVQHSWGSEFHPALHVALFDIVARKGEHSDVGQLQRVKRHRPRAPQGADHLVNAPRAQSLLCHLSIPPPLLRLKLKTFSHVFVAGLAANYCCKFTAIDTKRAGFIVMLLLPLTRGVGSPFDPQPTVQELERSGVRALHDVASLQR